METIETNLGIEREVKIAKKMSSSGETRDEVIANAVSAFLKSLGL